MKLSEHFTLAEMTQSEVAARRRIDNTPSDAAIANLRRLAERMEIVRGLLDNRPILISSGYRAPALNSAVGGASTSAHMLGLAADFICPGYGPPLAICKRLAAHANRIEFDQLIQEGAWVHIGFAAAGKQPRRQVLTAKFEQGGTVYAQGL